MRLYAPNVSQLNFRIKALTTTRNSTRTKPVPRRRAMRAPSVEPSMLHAAMGRATLYSTCPVLAKKARLTTLVATFTSFAEAEAAIKS